MVAKILGASLTWAFLWIYKWAGPLQGGLRACLPNGYVDFLLAKLLKLTHTIGNRSISRTYYISMTSSLLSTVALKSTAAPSSRVVDDDCTAALDESTCIVHTLYGLEGTFCHP